MTQEDKQLLLKDLCARLPYGVKCRFISSKGDIPSTIVNIDIVNEIVTHKPEGQSLTYFHFVESGNIKPYLRPMSSMTEEEEIYYNTIYTTLKFYEKEDWLNAHHFDYRGLIPMGLALEASEGMYNV